ncbi:MAG: glycine cleavage system protein H [Zetaproteobacteria bacterium]|nr:glycine cleavage system protein H [Pseudobdellovibrionaceae bacterium]|tara:strand:+ start:859 stop:1242 length:384 start_codon:yes stop_codon:yes gene_type:complete
MNQETLKRMYTKDHEWISDSQGLVYVGISSHAISELGDIVHIELPQVGDNFKAGESFGTVESTKTVSDIYMPGDGKVVDINSSMQENPEAIQEDPYQKGWLIKIELKDRIKSDLLNHEDYHTYIGKS